MRKWLCGVLLVACAAALPSPASAGAQSVSVQASVPALTISGLTYSPRPFDPNTGQATIAFTLSRPAEVTLRIRTIAGESIAVLRVPSAPAGPVAVLWSGRDSRRRAIAPTWYVCGVSAVAGQETTSAALTVAVSYGKALTMKALGVKPTGITPPERTAISASVTRDAYVAVAIRSPAGAVVRTHTEQLWSAGGGSFTWDGRTDAGAWVPAGKYTCTMTGRDSGGRTASVSQAVTVRARRSATAAVAQASADVAPDLAATSWPIVWAERMAPIASPLLVLLAPSAVGLAHVLRRRSA
jgi:hypothetical protein